MEKRKDGGVMMEEKRRVVISNKKGIHARTAAMITSFVNIVRTKYNVRLYIQKEKDESRFPLANMLTLAALKIKKGDILYVIAEGENRKEALEEICNYISGEIDQRVNDIEEIDKLLEEHTINITSELKSITEIKNKFGSILNHMGDGICLMDNRGIITYLNPAYENIFNIKKEDIIGQHVKKIYPNRPSVGVLDTKEKIIDILIRGKDGKRILSSAVPIFAHNKFKGVITTYKDVTELEEVIQRLHKAEEKIKYYEEELSKNSDVDEAFNIIIGNSSLLKDVKRLSSKAAKTSVNVMVRGESGTGKELVAKAIHKASKRKDQAFIKVNCAAIPENLLESELFGYERGAFTGASKRKIGKFELANGGTLFLDEIGETNYNIQAKLLRAIQEKEIERLGGNELIKIDIKIICATNRNLEDMVNNNEFREDLYYRLNVIPIVLPPLRNRKEDIGLLAEHFIEKICKEESMDEKSISREALNHLKEYCWPGNIRELENIITRSITLSDRYEIDVDNLPSYMRNDKRKNDGLINFINGDLARMEDYDREIVRLALKKHKSFNKAAKALGLTHRTVSLKAKKYNLI
ncbi:MAG: sigma 54-interacting transcriptional regulator [Anaeromicrobium sp.]|nr:sigma 54-interacting transcriptional regulator [Anaeromicrobium sp.]